MDRTSAGPTSRTSASSDSVYVTLPRSSMAERIENMLHIGNTQTHTQTDGMSGFQVGTTHLEATMEVLNCRVTGDVNN